MKSKTPNPLAVALGKLGRGVKRCISPAESDARRARAAHARSVKAAKAAQ